MSDDRKPIDVPDADAQEQEQDWVPSEAPDENPRLDIDVPEADALDQARSVELDDEGEERA